MRRVLLLFLVLYAGPHILHGKGHNTLEISLVAAMQPECPLSVSGIEMLPHNKGYGARVSNSSKLKVTEYEIHWIAAAPPGCSPKAEARPTVLSRAVHATIAPNDSATSPASRVQTTELAKIAGDLGTAHLQVQVGVARVRFENGSFWQADSDDEIFAPSLLKQDSDKCQQAQ